jgi:hypothetical protein
MTNINFHPSNCWQKSMHTTTALPKAWHDGSNLGSDNSISQYPARHYAIVDLFLSSTFVFQFGFSYQLEGMLISRLRQCFNVSTNFRTTKTT